MRRLAERLLLLAALALAALSVQASLPEPVKALVPAWRNLGSGDASFLGLRLYGASLWVSGQAYREDAPFALALTYARGFSRDTLVSTSLDEMRRLVGTAWPAGRASWSASFRMWRRARPSSACTCPAAVPPSITRAACPAR